LRMMHSAVPGLHEAVAVAAAIKELIPYMRACYDGFYPYGVIGKPLIIQVRPCHLGVGLLGSGHPTVDDSSDGRRSAPSGTTHQSPLSNCSNEFLPHPSFFFTKLSCTKCAQLDCILICGFLLQHRHCTRIYEEMNTRFRTCFRQHPPNPWSAVGAPCLRAAAAARVVPQAQASDAAATPVVGLASSLSPRQRRLAAKKRCVVSKRVVKARVAKHTRLCLTWPL
jgi:hypothetical protein